MIYYDQAGFIPDMLGWFKQKSKNIFHHVERTERTKMIISIFRNLKTLLGGIQPLTLWVFFFSFGMCRASHFKENFYSFMSNAILEL